MDALDTPARDVQELSRDAASARIREELNLVRVVTEHLKVKPEALLIEGECSQIQRRLDLGVKLFNVGHRTIGFDLKQLSIDIGGLRAVPDDDLGPPARVHLGELVVALELLALDPGLHRIEGLARIVPAQGEDGLELEGLLSFVDRVHVEQQETNRDARGY